MRFLRRFRTPTPAYFRLTPHEARVALAWGFTEQSWQALTDQRRAYYRTNYTKAPRYTT